MANRFQVGELEVLVLSDGMAAAPGNVYFAGTTPEQWEPHKRWLSHAGNWEFPFGCFLVRSGERRILIDTGLGPVDVWGFHGGALVGELAAAGVKPEDIDTVFVTHLHSDHCGTCALPEGESMKPVFPNATYRWTGEEHAYWQTAEAAARALGFSHKAMIECIGSRYEVADGGTSLAPGITVMAMPGHTPGHAGVVLSSATERAFILGDAISCPVQLEQPEWSGLGDIDPKLARRTQEAVLKEIESDGALVGASHFPGLTFGRVLRGEGRRYWQPL